MGDSGSGLSASQALDLEHADLLAQVELFAGLERVTLAKLAAHLEAIDVASGAELFRQGDPGDAFYVVARGSFGAFVSAEGDPAERRVNTRGPGDPLGEMALLSSRSRSATIRAETDAVVLRLERGRFLALVREEPSVALAIARSLSDRLRARDTPAPQTGGVAERALSIEVPAAGAAPPERKRRVNARVLGGILAAAVLAAGWTLPPPTGLSTEGWHALATMGALVPLLAFNALPEGILALLLASVWVLGGVTTPALALSGFSAPGWVLLVSVLVIGAAIASSGLLYRLALWTVAHSRGGFAGQITVLCVGGALLSPAVPNATARITLVAPAIGELAEALGYAARSRPAAGLAMAALIGFGLMVAPFLTSSTTALLVYAVLPPVGNVELDFVSWAILAAPPNAILLLGMIAALLWAYRPGSQAETRGATNRGTVRLQRKLIGRTTRNERASIVVGIALLVGFVTQPLHGIHPAWVAVLALTAMAATGVVTVNTLRAVNWSFALLFGILASLSSVFGATGVDRWIAASVTGLIGSLASMPLLFVVVLTLLCFAVSFVLRWQVAAPLVTIAVAPIAAAAGIHPFVVGMVAIMACSGFFVAYQSNVYIAMFQGTGERMFTHAQARPAALAYGVLVLFALCASVVPWRMMGLL